MDITFDQYNAFKTRRQVKGITGPLGQEFMREFNIKDDKLAKMYDDNACDKYIINNHIEWSSLSDENI